MDKIPITIRAVLKEKGPKRTYKKGQVGEFSKCTLSLYTVDDQCLFVEVRNKRIEELDNIQEGSIVDVDLIFLGSEKNEKRYNNLIVVKIEKL